MCTVDLVDSLYYFLSKNQDNENMNVLGNLFFITYCKFLAYNAVIGTA